MIHNNMDGTQKHHEWKKLDVKEYITVWVYLNAVW